MKRLRLLLNNSVGRKIIVAVTGVMLIGFVLAHLAGNLQVFLGAEAINDYAAKLHDLGPVLWLFRIGLLAAFVIHIVFVARLAISNRAAIGSRKSPHRRKHSSLASRWMMLSGVVVLAFVVFHLLHFTWGVIQPDASTLSAENGDKDVYSMIVVGFQSWAIAGIYVTAMALLGMHLSHALISVVQTLGIVQMRQTASLKVVLRVIGWCVAVGFASIPVAVLVGLLQIEAKQ